MKKAILLSTFLIATMLPFMAAGQWSSNPAVNNPINAMMGEQAIPKIATCPNGDYYIAFFSNESGNYNVRMQRLDSEGNIQWANNGILISNHLQMSWLTDWDMTADNENHAILTFQDIRNNGNNNVVAYRISPSGDFAWGDDGIALSNSTAFDVSPKVCVTAAGNAVFAWQADNVIILQKIDQDGTLLWGPSGITLSGSYTYSWPQLLPIGTDEVILKYFEDSGTPWAPTRHVYAQRFNASGNPVWAIPTAISTAGGISAWTQIFPFINDGSDGFYIAWHDDRDMNMLASAYVQHISNSGAVLFQANGVEATVLGNRNHFYPHLAMAPGSSDVYVFWNEMDVDQNLRGIYGQKITASGLLQWQNTGKVFIEISFHNVYPFAARSTPEDVVLFYDDYYDNINSQLMAMRVDKDGDFVWTPSFVPISSVNSEKVHVEVNEIFNNQWILSWEDTRSGDRDIYAQNILLNGYLGIAQSADLIVKAMDTYNNILNNVMLEITGPEGNYSGTITTDSLIFQDLPYGVYTGTAWMEGAGPVEQEIILGDSNHYMIFVFDLTGIIDQAGEKQYDLKLNPNPFGSSVIIEYNLEKASRVILEIRSMDGVLLKTLADAWQNSGAHRINWQGYNDGGMPVPPGPYILIFRTSGQVSSKLLIKQAN